MKWNRSWNFAIVCIFAVICSGCGHLNQLRSVNIRNSVVLSDFHAVGDAARGIVCLGNLSARPLIKDSSGVIGQIINTVGSIGGAIASSSVESKIARSSSPDSLAWAVASGFGKSLERYASVRFTSSVTDKSDFIAETLLERYELSSSQFGIYATVCVTSRIIERATGKKIWQNSETKTIPLSNVHPATIFSPIGRSVGGVINMVQILSMSDDEVRNVLYAAASDTGWKMGETLRVDISE
jgi:hypothetical protein